MSYYIKRIIKRVIIYVQCPHIHIFYFYMNYFYYNLMEDLHRRPSKIYRTFQFKEFKCLQNDRSV